MREINSYKSYSKLASSENDPDKRSGRNIQKNSKHLNKLIFNDSFQKLTVKRNQSILSIGIGCGELSRLWLEKSVALNLDMTFVDFPLVLNRIKEDNNKNILKKVDFIEGIFPNQTAVELKNRLFDRIEAYSVIHYSDNPYEFINFATSLLKPGGKLLIGDIPNLSKKGRFLSSKFGNNFDLKFTNNISVNRMEYKDHQTFVKNALQNGSPELTDSFVLKVVKALRNKGFNVFILNQHSKLPFFYTREDILIEAPLE